MSEVHEFDPVDRLAAGAIGEPGNREFLLQAQRGDVQITILLEKQQVAVMAAEAMTFLDRIDSDESLPTSGDGIDAALREPAIASFRARAVGMGYDPRRQTLLIELREHAVDDDEPDDEDAEGWIVRIYATKPQLRAACIAALDAVSNGRPICEWCELPMNPDGHLCPKWN